MNLPSVSFAAFKQNHRLNTGKYNYLKLKQTNCDLVSFGNNIGLCIKEAREKLNRIYSELGFKEECKHAEPPKSTSFSDEFSDIPKELLDLFMSKFEKKKLEPTEDDKYRGKYHRVINELYDQIRLAKYPESIFNIDEFNDIKNKSNEQSGIIARYDKAKYWIARIQNHQSNNPLTHRLTINANPSASLIKKIDDLYASGILIGEYKFPNNYKEWFHCHDPLILYINDEPNQEQIDKVKEACFGHTRDNDEALIGKVVAQGIAIEKLPNEQDIENILSKAAQIDPAFEEAIRQEMRFYAGEKLIMSTGQMAAVNKLINMLEK